MKQHRMRYAASEVLGHLWIAFPAERKTLLEYADRAKSYRSDCGCAVGGAFVVATLALLVLYGLAFHEFTLGHWLRDTLFGIASLLAAAFAGKIAGIGIARMRLVLLGRELRKRFHMQRS